MWALLVVDGIIITMPKRTKPKIKQVHFRVPEDVLRQLENFGSHYSRSLNAEVNLALEAWPHQHALALLRDPQVERELGKEKVKAEQRKIEEALNAVYQRAFSRPDPRELLSSLNS